MTLRKKLKKIQMRLLPPSSRSFHSATYDIRYDVNQLRQEIASLQEQLNRQSNQLNRRMDELSSDMAIHDTHMKLYGDVFFRQENETPHETRKRFFHSLPKADEPFRTFQLCNSKLLHKLEELCQQHHLDYWLGFGSLIGAASCEGLIPWDDDVDICMMREDGMALYELLKEDPEYQITLVYDYFALVKQFRFSHRSPDIPCFIDVSLWDWARDCSEKNERRLRELRRSLIDSLTDSDNHLDYWRQNPYLFAPGSNYVVQCGPVDLKKQKSEPVKREIEKIEVHFKQFYEKAKAEGIFCDRSEASAVAFGLENLSEDAPWRRYIWPKDMIFPTQQILFEGGFGRVPKDMKGFCDECYPGWPYLPKDILGHNHFARELLKDPKVYETMKKYISE